MHKVHVRDVTCITAQVFNKDHWSGPHAREPLYSNSAVTAWWSQSTSGNNDVFMCTLLLKKVINFLIFYF